MYLTNLCSMLLKLLASDKHCTDSTLEDFADDYGFDLKDVMAAVAIIETFGTPCAGCEYAALRPNCYPCTYCSRMCKDQQKESENVYYKALAAKLEELLSNECNK